MHIDWENDNAVPASFEVQVGKMFTPNFGVFVEGLIGVGGDRRTTTESGWACGSTTSRVRRLWDRASRVPRGEGLGKGGFGEQSDCTSVYQCSIDVVLQRNPNTATENQESENGQAFP